MEHSFQGWKLPLSRSKTFSTKNYHLCRDFYCIISKVWENDQCLYLNLYLNMLGIVVKYKLSNDYFTDRLSSKQRCNIINCERKIRTIVTYKNFSLSINTKIHCPLLMSCYARHTVYDTFHSFQSINYNRHFSIHFHHSSTRPNILEHYHIQRSSKWTKANVIQILIFNLTKGENLTASEQNERHKQKYRLYSSATKDTVKKSKGTLQKRETETAKAWINN